MTPITHKVIADARSHPYASRVATFSPTFTMQQEELLRFMREAMAEGRRALPECKPNPPVGCVLVRNGEIIARGYTHPPGQYHAEAHALAQVGGDLSDVTAFVTLEPCSFAQRTPSCAKALAHRKIAKVYVAIVDPHPRNQGVGLRILRESGIDVELGLCGDEVTEELGPHLIGE